MESRLNWQSACANPPPDWTPEDIRIAEMLAAGASTPDIARALGQHRSMIWRKTQRLKKHFEEKSEG